MRSERLFTADIKQIKSYVLLFVRSMKKLDIWANDSLCQWVERIKILVFFILFIFFLSILKIIIIFAGRT